MVSSESSPGDQSITVPDEESTVSKPLLKLKLLNVLRKGSFQDLYNLIDKEFIPKGNSTVREVASLILHYAVQVAPLQLIKDIVEKRNEFNQLGFGFSLIDINEKDSAGNTPLHMAAFQSRGDVVSYLMDLPAINDTLLNNLNLQALEMCKDLNVTQLMQYKRSNYIAEIAGEFRTAFNNRDFQHLESILSKPRNFNLLDINGMDPKTGDTVLHEFVKKRDVIMCRWLLEHGADPFKRDAKGRLPLDLLKKVDTSNYNGNGKGSVDSISNKTTATTKLAIDMELKKLLEKSAMEQSVIDITGVNVASPATISNTDNKIVINSDASVSKIPQPPTFKGYLKKWTNFAQGYKLRYFILSADGRLSYFIDQSDTQNACRGSLSVSNCSLHLDSSETLKFEIISGVHNSPSEIRWHLKGNHPIETNRWVWTIQGAIRYAKDKNRGLLTSMANPSQLHESLSLVDNVVDNNMLLPHNPVEDSLSSHFHHRQTPRSKEVSPRAMAIDTNESNDVESVVAIDTTKLASRAIKGPDLRDSNDPNTNNEIKNVSGQIEANYLEETDDSESETDDDGEIFDIINGTNGEDLQITYGPFSHKLHMLKRSITIDFTELTELLSDGSIQGNTFKGNDTGVDIWDTVEKTLITMNTNFQKLDELTQQRDKKLISMLSKQRDLNNVWIQSMKELELELIDKDTKLINLTKERKQLKKLLDNASRGTQKNNEKNDTSITTSEEAKNNNEDDSNNGGASHGTLQQIADSINTSESVSDGDDTDIDEFFDAEEASVNDNTSTIEHPTEKETEATEQLIGEVVVNKTKSETEMMGNKIIKSEGTIAVQQKEGQLETEHTNEIQLIKFEELQKDGSFSGYENGHRNRLKLDADNRPKVSLWGVLKSMVGKDVTKMTLPVSFNEPSSMLQRLAEDIEYSDLLQYASQFSDSTLRMLYVAAFSASPYASTINRIAKPFNPLLGETFEYADIKKEFRFFTEQVSHHPPISASWAESPKWDYYGESNVDSKFTGRAFTIKHLGRWYVNIRPDNDPVVKEETYTYMKPLNTVIGILVGKPEVDNSGEVKIENRTTGDYCMITYKARGWTAVSAYEVHGDVYNKDGIKCWTFGGRWNNALFAKKIVDNTKTSISASNNTIDVDIKNDANMTRLEEPRYDGSRFLIWKVHKRLEKVPFNLTPFAITLNDPQPTLLEWVAPTDTRLRPDQRAMEDGLYDEAAAEKHRLEEQQRAVRKEREANNGKYYPKYFNLEMDPVTHDRVWKFKGDYWALRKQHKWEDSYTIY